MTCLNIIQLAGDAAQLAEGREGPPSLLCVCEGKATGVYFAEEMDSESKAPPPPRLPSAFLVSPHLEPSLLKSFLRFLALYSNKARPAKFALVFQVGSLCRDGLR